MLTDNKRCWIGKTDVHGGGGVCSVEVEKEIEWVWAKAGRRMLGRLSTSARGAVAMAG